MYFLTTKYTKTPAQRRRLLTVGGKLEQDNIWRNNPQPPGTTNPASLFSRASHYCTFGVVVVASDGAVEHLSIGLHSSTWKPSAVSPSVGPEPPLEADASRRIIRSVPIAPYRAEAATGPLPLKPGVFRYLPVRRINREGHNETSETDDKLNVPWCRQQIVPEIGEERSVSAGQVRGSGRGG